ncbi:hypothetical protein FGO68_gene13357 [Halteria grandinella]|uniref:histidine kinase n=1 Tax=Halteria grandinella TaxID=5974 RepID=A0A8J8T730_HALGN|nr:hypothetical protein FGO68_gene13357 [Halteria grandinella]
MPQLSGEKSPPFEAPHLKPSNSQGPIEKQPVENMLSKEADQLDAEDQRMRGLLFGFLRFHTYSSFFFMMVEAFMHYYMGEEGSVLRRATPLFVSFTIMKTVLYQIETKNNEWFKRNGSLIILGAFIIGVSEQQIFLSPDKYVVFPVLLIFLATQEFLELAMSTTYQRKKVHRIIFWGYHIIRNFVHYGDVPHLMVASIIALIISQQMTAEIYENFLSKLQRHANELKSTFNGTINLIPTGVMIIDVSTKSFSFINKEMAEFLSLKGHGQINDQEGAKQQVALFVQKNTIFTEYQYALDQASSVKRSTSANSGDSLGKFRDIQEKKKENKASTSQRTNLWEVLINLNSYIQSEKVDSIFKSHQPRRYIQVRSQLINNGSQIMAICTDITRLKDVEAQARQMRSSFFSSIAHELRTPLNSVIPILKLVQQFLSAKGPINVEKIARFINIALNSSMHLENVIEDALDISRLENNKFQIFKETIEVRDCVRQVLDIMKFQVEQKGLALHHEIGREVPLKIVTDQKRFKQVLFNLLGNAIKFTFEGSIQLAINFDDQKQILKVKIKDTGVGIQPDDLNKLFKFFGCLSKTKDINKGGMGLGLTISKMIVQQLGGEITAKSTPQTGSEFSFWIPIESNARKTHIIHEEFSDLEQTIRSVHRDRERKSSWAPNSRGFTPKSSSKFQPVQGFKRKSILSKSSTLSFKHSSTTQKIVIENLNTQKESSEKQINSENEDGNDRTENFNITNCLQESPLNQREQEKTFADMYLELQEKSCVAPSAFLQQEYYPARRFPNAKRSSLLKNQRVLETIICLSSQRERTSSSVSENTSLQIERDKTIRILCVDDSANNLFVLKEMVLSMFDDDSEVIITTALNGKIAFDLIKSKHAEARASVPLFDMILMDLQMPVMNGFQTAAAIREFTDEVEGFDQDYFILAVSAISKMQFQTNQDSELFDGFRKIINISNYLLSYSGEANRLRIIEGVHPRHQRVQEYVRPTIK